MEVLRSYHARTCGVCQSELGTFAGLKGIIGETRSGVDMVVLVISAPTNNEHHNSALDLARTKLLQP